MCLRVTRTNSDASTDSIRVRNGRSAAWGYQLPLDTNPAGYGCSRQYLRKFGHESPSLVGNVRAWRKPLNMCSWCSLFSWVRDDVRTASGQDATPDNLFGRSLATNISVDNLICTTTVSYLLRMESMVQKLIQQMGLCRNTANV